MDQDKLLNFLQSQVDEISAVQSVFEQDGEFLMTPAQKDVLQFAQKMVQGESSFSVKDVPSISGKILIQNVQLSGSPIALRFDLPSTYPEASPNLAIECSTDNSNFQTLTNSVSETIQECAGEECLIACVEQLREAATQLMQQELQQQSENSSNNSKSNTSNLTKILSICLIWFHHIKNPNKKKNIQNWAYELKLGGYCKPGYPGVVIVEGEDSNVQEYVRRLRALNWQAMQVRAFEKQELEQGEELEQDRKFKNKFLLLGEMDLSEMGQYCKEVGLEELFLTALKISKK